MRFIYAFWLGVLVCGCAHSQVIGNRETLPPAGSLELATAVVQDAPRLGDVWPGYWTDHQPFAISDSGSTIVYKPKGPAPPGYGPVPGRTSYWFFAGVPPSLARRTADLYYDVGDTMVTAVRIDTGEAEALDLLFHEAFHVYQEAQFGPWRPFTWNHGFPDTVPGMREQEKALLRCATTATDSDDIRTYAIEYVKRRLARTATEQDSIVQAEHRVERKEGSAQWIGMKMQGIVLGRTDPMVRREIADLFDWAYPAGPVQMFADGLPFDRRQSLYATGAAIMEVVSHLTPDSWQRAIAGGSSPFQVLVEVLGEGVLRGAIIAAPVCRFQDMQDAGRGPG